MTILARSSSIAFLVAVSASVAVAQAPAVSPRVSIVLQGANRLMEDTQAMMSLSDEGRLEWKDVNEFAEEIFFVGIDKARPVRIDVIVGDGPTRYRPSFPVADQADFLVNLEDFGIEQRRITGQTNYWELRDAFEGFLRIKDGYGSLGEKAEDVPTSLPSPLVDVGPLLAANFDLAAEVVNAKTEEADRAARRTAFEKDVREELLAKVARKDDESKEDYELRKVGIAHQLEDLERYYADTQRAVAGWTADVGTTTGTSDLVLDPIPGSDLEAAIALLGKEPSHFAAIPRADAATLSLRVNHPLDPLRKKHHLESFELLRPALESQIAESDRTPDEKAATSKLAGLVVDMLVAGTQAGLGDGFIEVSSVAGGAQVGIAGIRAADGKAADAIVQLLPQARAGTQVKMNAATVGEVSIHEITLPLEKQPDFVFLFGQNPTMYVGTSAEAVWFAAGPDALQTLQTALELVANGTPEASPKFVDLYVRLLPWMQYRARKAGEFGDPELRAIALSALGKGDDSLSLELSRTETGVAGRMLVKEAVFRLVGRFMAKFADENL